MYLVSLCGGRLALLETERAPDPIYLSKALTGAVHTEPSTVQPWCCKSQVAATTPRLLSPRSILSCLLGLFRVSNPVQGGYLVIYPGHIHLTAESIDLLMQQRDRRP